VEAKLIEDMKNLAYQIGRVSDTAKGTAVRVFKVENVAWEDNETTMPELQARIEKTIAFLEAIPTTASAEEDAEVVLPTRSGLFAHFHSCCSLKRGTS
jgi:hypothetical protein